MIPRLSISTQVPTVSSGRLKPSQKVWRRTTPAAAVNLVTCHTCSHATPPSTCAGWPGR